MGELSSVINLFGAEVFFRVQRTRILYFDWLDPVVEQRAFRILVGFDLHFVGSNLPVYLLCYNNNNLITRLTFS